MKAWLVSNPVLNRELLERWRGRRGFVILTAYLSVVTLLVMAMAWIISTWINDTAEFRGEGFLAQAGPAMGRGIFENLLALVLFFVLFFTPAYAAAQISGEREKRTLSLLQVTLVRPSQIVAGKLVASVAWLTILVLAAAPIAATGFYLGGVTVGDFLRSVALIMVVAVSVAAVALGLSSIARKTTTAIVLTYVFVIGLLVGPLFGALVEAAFRQFDFPDNSRPIALYAEPYYGLADAVGADRFDLFGEEFPSLLLPFALALPPEEVGFFTVEEQAVEGELAPFEAQPLVPPFEDDFVVDDPRQAVVSQRPVWEITALIHALFGIAGFVVATRNVRPGKGPRHRVSKAERAEMTANARTPVVVEQRPEGRPRGPVEAPAPPPMDPAPLAPPPPPPAQQEQP
jgi:hypothetical protein